MFTSLRSRLWLTYVLLAGGVICIIAAGLVIFILRNPSQVRQSYQRVLVIASLVENREFLLEITDPAQLKQAMQNADKVFGVRILLYDASGKLQLDSRASAGAFPRVDLPTPGQAQVRYQARDLLGRVWVYAARPLPDGGWVVVATQASRSALFQALRDDLIPPMVEAGLVALVAAMIFAVWITRWVSSPLRRITKAAHAISGGDYQPIPLQGPSEVKELGQAFNDMVARVDSSQKAQRDFVANVSHELKTPLTSIQGFAQAILDGTAGTPEALRQAGTVIYDEAGRMYRLVLGLLDLARLDSGIADLQRSPLDLAAIVNAVVDKMKPQASQAQVSLNSAISPLPPILGDADRLSQVFTNLVDNTVKYTPAGGQIFVEALQVDGKVQVTISDSGAGIASDDLPHIFERFYQTDKSRSGSRRGAGLGLAIAREIVLAHHGSIEVASTPGQGSSFVVKIPLARPEDASQARRRA